MEFRVHAAVFSEPPKGGTPNIRQARSQVWLPGVNAVWNKNPPNFNLTPKLRQARAYRTWLARDPEPLLSFGFVLIRKTSKPLVSNFLIEAPEDLRMNRTTTRFTF